MFYNHFQILKKKKKKKKFKKFNFFQCFNQFIAAKLQKNNEKSSVNSINSKTEKKQSKEELIDKTLIVDKLSQTLNFLSSIFQLFLNQFNFEGIANSDAIESNNSK